MDISFDIPVQIILDESFSVFKWSSFSRGYHVYKDRWQPTVGDDSLHCQQEKDVECNKHGVAIIYDSFYSNKVLGQIPFYWSKFTNTFLKFPSHHIRLVGVGKNVNRGIGLGLEIPVDYFFHGDNRVIKWFKKSKEKIDECTDVRVEKYMK